MRDRLVLAGVVLAVLGLLTFWRVPPASAMIVTVLIPGDGTAAANGGHFTNSPPLDLSLEDGWDSFSALTGDVNGDGRVDLIWNKVDSSNNRTYVALATATGAFTFLPPDDHPVADWGYTTHLVGDVNGDGRADQVWITVTSSTNRVYVGLGKADGTFEYLPVQDRGTGQWRDYQVLAGDINGDGRADLIWNAAYGESNRTSIGLARKDGTFKFLNYQEHPTKGWEDYETRVGDVNADGRADLIWSRYIPGDATIRTYVAFGGVDGTLTFGEYQDLSSDITPYDPHYEETYTTSVADVNGDGASDLIWAGRYYDATTGSKEASGAGDIIVALGSDSGEFQRPKRTDQLFLGPNDRFPYALGQFADVTGDSRDDVIMTVWDNYGENLVYLVLRNEDGELTTLPFEAGPRIDVRTTTRIVADVTGDGRADLVWNKKFGPVNRLYVGRANANGTFTFLTVQDFLRGN